MPSQARRAGHKGRWTDDPGRGDPAEHRVEAAELGRVEWPPSRAMMTQKDPDASDCPWAGKYT